MADINECPDCGELLQFRRGVAFRYSSTFLCPSCGWNENEDGDRQNSPQEDYLIRNSDSYKFERYGDDYCWYNENLEDLE